ncbi:MAG: Rne/Rng family ribonuclease [Myxococcales bacterium]|nr:Rne/Rng family ribonuclease [Myxococcales bacterium]MCB9648281.1 Rne/Rng family ribonuclease [Deltaproteobacteria bacterium]
MPAEILVNRALGETRVAFLEDGAVTEFHVERDEGRNVVGSIYRGRVTRVLPGMQAAFVQVGLERAAFLYVDDVVTEDVAEEELDEDETPSRAASAAERPPIEALLREGQEVTVQVVKAPLGTKGARVTTYLTIPGRYVVYMPTIKRIGVSRRITSEAERKRLKEVVASHQRPDEGGFIVRTVCEGLTGEEIAQDMEFVRSLWQEVADKANGAPVPSLVQPDLDLVLRATRDLFTDEVAAFRIDDPRQVERVKKLVARFAPHLVDRVVEYEDPVALFERYGVDQALERALLREIHLKNGVSIVIDEAEALAAIDVNTGRFVGSRDLEATILETNLAAAQEIAAQIRLRNLGGIIIVDFIDMQAPESREKVYNKFVEALRHDRAKTHALSMSGLGLLEMTRKRTTPSLGRTLTEPCPYCEGRGRIRSRHTVCLEILREVERQARLHPEGDIVVSAMPEVAARLAERESGHVEALEQRLARPIVVEARSDLHQEVYQVLVRAPSGVRP